MKLSKDRIGILTRELVKRLTAGRYIVVDIPESELTRKITEIITEELMMEDRIEAEARQILKSYESDIQKGDVDSHKMFLMIKKKLAKERGIIL